MAEKELSAYSRFTKNNYGVCDNPLPPYFGPLRFSLYLAGALNTIRVAC